MNRSKAGRDESLLKETAPRKGTISLPAERPNVDWYKECQKSIYHMCSSLGISLWSDGEWYA